MPKSECLKENLVLFEMEECRAEENCAYLYKIENKRVQELKLSKKVRKENPFASPDCRHIL